MSERQAYLWYVPETNVPAHAARVVATGATHVRVKAGGDDGKVWAQWRTPAVTQPYRDVGLVTSPWFYIWPGENDKAAIVRAQQFQGFDEVALNPETEWRVQSRENPWNSLAEANAAAAAWVTDLRSRLAPGTHIPFSSVPSWDDFPYEGFAQACDSAEPQHYWFGSELARGENQVQAHVRRAGATMRCVPILTASREHDDAGVVQLGRDALTALPTLAGFSSWECGNAAYQWQAMTDAYALLPDGDVQAETTPPRPVASPFLASYAALWR